MGSKRCELPIGTQVKVTEFEVSGGRTYIGKIVGYDLGRTKYEVGHRIAGWGRWLYAGGGSWAFPAEVEVFDPSPLELRWESALTDEPGDQNAETQLVAHGHWSLGPDGKGGWGVELIVLDGDLQEVEGAGVHLGSHDTEEAAKAAAQDYEIRMT